MSSCDAEEKRGSFCLATDSSLSCKWTILLLTTSFIVSIALTGLVFLKLTLVEARLEQLDRNTAEISVHRSSAIEINKRMADIRADLVSENGKHRGKRTSTSSTQSSISVDIGSVFVSAIKRLCKLEGAVCIEGPKGEPGRDGLPGLTGHSGIAGPPGLAGQPGAKGLAGKQGPRGETGLKGEMGAKGQRGEKGERGLPGVGETGLKGEMGAKGQRGEKGDPGLPGVGEMGLKGEMGGKGQRGEKGDPGLKGEMGAKGQRGEKGERGASIPESCREIKELGFDQGNKMYYINPLHRGIFQAYCDMTTLGGGWTLVLNQIGDSSHYYTLIDSTCSSLDLNHEGTQCHLDRIFQNATEIRYTDDNQRTFLHAKLKGEEYWNAINWVSSTTIPLPVRYVSGPLAGPVRYIETQNNIHWGHRHSNHRPRGSSGPRSDIDSFPICKHVCWEDVRVKYQDRPFAGDHCSSTHTPAFCPGFNPEYPFPSSATRRGSMKYRKWIR